MYQTSGVVIRGKALGRTIGFPTLNLVDYSFKDNQVPAYGVYTCQVKIVGEMFKGVLHFGPKGALQENGEVFLEVHVFDFAQEIYGATVEVFFGAFLREVKKFSSLDELKLQIACDVGMAKGE